MSQTSEQAQPLCQDVDIGVDHPGTRALEMLEAVKFAASGGQCSTSIVLWLERALKEFIQGRQSDFGSALGFRPAERHELRRAMRNHYLLLALNEVDSQLSNRARCNQLAREIERFESRVWPRVRTYEVPDPSWSNLRCHIWRARQFDDKLPLHWQSIDRIQKLHRQGVVMQLHSGIR